MNVNYVVVTVDRATLLRRLQISFGLGGSALSWFHSYLSRRRQHVVHQGNSSPSSVVEFGVPQGWLGVGTDPVYHVHGTDGRRHMHRRTTQSQCTAVCRRHPALWSLSAKQFGITLS